jgi:hypothetical protein
LNVIEGTVAPDVPGNVNHLPVKLKVRGFGPRRVPSSSEEIEAISSGPSSKSNTSKLLAILVGFTDLGITMLPSWMCHLINT